MSDVVLYEVADRVATVTLNRPEARNALSREVLRLLHDALLRGDADEDIDVIILTGADPAFSAGIDLKEMGSSERGFAEPAVIDERDRRGPFPDLAKIVIGAINGVAVTGGFEVALNCDFLVASDRARFADTHARIGVQPGWGLTVLLAEAVGFRRAKELSATGNFLDAQTALAWGLVNHVVPHDELLPFTHQLAADVVSNEAAGVKRITQTYREQSLLTGDDAWRLESRVSGDWIRSGAGGSPAAVEERRRAVTERGRAQTS
jgi:enoyl-CoA hydratase